MNLYRLLLFVTLAVHVSSTDIRVSSVTDSHPQLDENASNGANGPGSSIPRSESTSSEPSALNSRRVTSSLDRRHPGNLVALEDGGRLDTVALRIRAPSDTPQNLDGFDTELANPVTQRPSRGRRCVDLMRRNPKRSAALLCYYIVIAPSLAYSILRATGNARRSLDKEGHLDQPVSEGAGTQRMERRGSSSKGESQEYEVQEECDCQQALWYMGEDGKLHPIPEGSSHGGTEEHTKREVFKSIYRRRLEDDDVLPPPSIVVSRHSLAVTIGGEGDKKLEPLGMWNLIEDYVPVIAQCCMSLHHCITYKSGWPGLKTLSNLDLELTDETKTMNLYRLLLFVTLAVHVSSTDIRVPPVTDSHPQLDENASNGAKGPGSSVLHSESTPSETPALSSHRGTSNVQNPNNLDVEQGLGNPVAPRPSQFVVRHQRAITLAGWCYIIGKPIIKNFLNGAGAKRRSLDEEGNLDLVSEGNGAQRMERRGPGLEEEGQEYEILPEQCDCQSATEYMGEDGKLHPIPEGSSHGGTEEHTKREVFKSFYRRRLEDDDGME
ncbi:hypothetical protein EV360DRAFT_66462 [Lentinula raphanica]|nr:hypothetical protein EV360DRAFT_66462 [Lentinula raphanica]